MLGGKLRRGKALRAAGRRGSVAAAIGVLLILLAAAGADGSAREVNGFVGGAPGTGAGHFLEPTDVTVLRGESGADNIFVVEGLAGNSRVQRLDGNGNFELSWGRDVVRDGARGDTGNGYEVCARAPTCKAGASGSGPGELATPSGIAVNESTREVYVLDGGNGRVQQFTLDGLPIRSWPLDVAGGGDRYEHAPIAVAPSEPHDVFVGDDVAQRVLQFDSEGEFVRAWGWGVATGAASFETCDDADRCRTGRRPPGLTKGNWPRHLAIDDEGIAYAAPFVSVVFDTYDQRTKIFRFETEDPPSPPSAADTLLRPLLPKEVGVIDDSDRFLTNGATLGLDIDPTSGRLLAITNPFGTSAMDEVRNLQRDERPRIAVVEQLPFLQNVTGIAATDGVVLLSSGIVDQATGTSTFTGCTRKEVERDCHGLVAIAAGGPPRAAMTSIPGIAGPAALVDPGGVATYRLEVSRDGRHWRPRGEPRYVTGVEPEPVAADLRGLSFGAMYKVRLVMSKKTDSGTESTTSPAMPFVAGMEVL